MYKSCTQKKENTVNILVVKHHRVFVSVSQIKIRNTISYILLEWL